MRKKIFMTAGMGLVMGNLKCAAVDDCSNVDGFSNPNAEIMAEIQKEEEDRIRSEQKNAAKLQLQEDKYKQDKEKLLLRKKRAEEAAEAKKLKARTAENEKFANGGISIEDHQKNLKDIETEYEREINKADDEYRTAYTKLKQMNPEGYRRVDW